MNMADEEKKLQMSFDLRTIEHLGIKMYSYIPNAIAELVANAYDADAKNVDIKLYEHGDKKRIEVWDDGHGMDFDEVNDKFLRIGRNRRDDVNNATISPNGRNATGKKGLGKLALFGLGNLIEITTTKKGSKEKLKFTLSWIDIKETKQKDYEPIFVSDESSPSIQGTSIVLRNLHRKSPFDKEGLAISLSRLFDCFSKDFRCFISVNDGEKFEIDNTLKFKNIDTQFNWKFPDDFEAVKPDYQYRKEINGKIISSEKPLSPGLRGISLFANGRLVNAPEFFGIPESSHVFSYLTGWFNVDFIDNIEEDAISTNRQSLNWELSITKELREFIAVVTREVMADWRIRRKKVNRSAIKTGTGIEKEEWFGALPDKIEENVINIFDALEREDGISIETQEKIAKELYSISPKYFYYHWRNLHPSVRDVSKQAYEDKDYYKALREAAKRYVKSVQAKAGNIIEKDHPLMGRVFGFENGMPKLLSVTKIYKRPDGSDFRPETIDSIENGHRELSQGIVRGCRNPLAHEEDIDLRDSDLFSEKDCLDALSLLSHLFRRLDKV